MGIFIKHIRDPYDPRDGLRYLVCEIPGDFSKDQLMLDGWIKELSPEVLYDDMDDYEWKLFRRSYYEKLIQPDKAYWIEFLAQKASQGNITILFVESHKTRNHATVLKTLLELKIKVDSEGY
ncbi:MAG: DUF488 family protein [Syntrophobacterales bacterium]|nr:DUF488 family protein [Syntrophobacterales bacterium]